ncbi:MAG TPA: hypothetical protein VN281_16175 [Verrucomicrobiae bacterium]|nr:hypothetical protein [Verrucomicrobiae bacterium]
MLARMTAVETYKSASCGRGLLRVIDVIDPRAGNQTEIKPDPGQAGVGARVVFRIAPVPIPV